MRKYAVHLAKRAMKSCRGRNVEIDWHQARKIKLPDAIIAATVLCSGTELLTLDQHLLSVVNSTAKLK